MKTFVITPKSDDEFKFIADFRFVCKHVFSMQQTPAVGVKKSPNNEVVL